MHFISSTYQVGFVGTTVFTMPDLYHVVNGIELFSPKFNVVPPGVNELLFPYSHGRSVTERSRTVEEMLFTLEDSADIWPPR